MWTAASTLLCALACLDVAMAIGPPGRLRLPIGFRAHDHVGLKIRREARELYERGGHDGGDGGDGSDSGNSTGNYIFRTPQTEKYLVTSLPEVDFDFGELYAGSIPINKANATAGELFFFFKPKEGGVKVDEITIWLNGGPGCSSSNGFWQENGPIQWQPGTIQPEPNPYAWSNLTNMLWVDQPIGTGYSVGTPYATSEEDIAGPFLEWFKNWQDEFGVKDNKVFVTGESYAGRYVPYIAGAMVDANNTESYDIQGILVYDPCIGEYNTVQEQIPAFPFVQSNANLFGFNDSLTASLAEMHETCGYREWIDKYLTFPPSGPQPPTFFNYSSNSSCDIFDTIYAEAFSINPCFNPYEINIMCPLMYDPLGFPGSFDWMPRGQTKYFDRPDVKAALHAPNITWSLCSENPVFVGNGGPQSNGDSSPDPIQGVLPKVIEKTNRVLVGNGDFDFIIITNGTLLAIQNMTWGGELGFQSEPNKSFIVTEPDIEYTAVFEQSGLDGLNGPQGTMGKYHFERGLMWVETYMSGHMQPEYQPRAAYLHLRWLLGQVENFDG